MNRTTYSHPIINTLSKQNVMVFLMGPRQVGKTTLSQFISQNYDQSLYLNWDIDEHRDFILSGQKFIERIFPPERIGQKPLIIFDEIHKYKNWKNFIKGFFDLYQSVYHMIITGSSHLNVFQKGEDSLMGRYFPYTLHPISLGELNPNPTDALYRCPHNVSEEDFSALYEFGGFPAPFFQKDKEGYNQWKRTRRSQLFREDIRDLTHIHEISQVELCAHLLSHQSGQIFNRFNIAKKLKVSIPTISRWVDVLNQFYFSFSLSPWTRNIPNSLIKEPKIYLNDWSLVVDPGARFENFVACHLKKAVDFWCDTGKGDFSLYFLRDKNQREVDFLVTRDQEPWVLVEAKTSEQPITPSLYYYHSHTKAPFAFQVTKEMPYVNYNCFSKEGLFSVPARTFLSQLI